MLWWQFPLFCHGLLIFLDPGTSDTVGENENWEDHSRWGAEKSAQYDWDTWEGHGGDAPGSRWNAATTTGSVGATAGERSTQEPSPTATAGGRGFTRFGSYHTYQHTQLRHMNSQDSAFGRPDLVFF